MPNFLNDIVAYKKKLNKEKRPLFDSMKKGLSKATRTRYQIFKKSISTPNKINLIAEIKKASPSKGLIRKDFDPMEIAKIYADNKADAISVLTEDKYFLGRPEYVKKVSANINVPILAKDFFVDEGQVYEAAFNGASAILLIASILSRKELETLFEVASSLDMDSLFEVHNEKELELVLDAGAEIIGVNNRDLKTFKVDLAVSEELIPKIPSGKVVVSESGIESNYDVLKLKEIGAHAVLIGESFMRSDNIASKIEEIMHGKN